MSANSHPARAAEVQEVLAAIFEVAACTDSLTEVLRTTYEQLGRIMDNSNFYIALYDPDTELYSFPFSVDTDDDDFTPQRLDGSLTDYVRRTGRSLLADDSVHKAMIEAREVSYVGGYSPIWLGAPLRTANGVFGAAVVQSYVDATAFSVEDQRVLEMVCNGVSNAIEAAWARENVAARQRLELSRLKRSRDQALRASAAKSTFLANMSHELRTPLNAIIGYAELLLDDLEVEGQEQGQAELGNIRTAAHHLLRVINDILDLSRVEAGKEPILKDDFTVAALADTVRNLSAPLAEGAGVHFGVSVLDDHALSTDQKKLVQVVMNLVGNACKFARGRSVTVRLGRASRPGWTLFEVSDTGDGIAPDQLERLFEPFEQADATIHREHGGTGLGLAISRRFCQAMGGELTAKSIPGRGSTFRVDIPSNLPAGLSTVVGSGVQGEKATTE